MSKASRLKGHCNRLVAIFELPAHQRAFLLAGCFLNFQNGSQSCLFANRGNIFLSSRLSR